MRVVQLPDVATIIMGQSPPSSSYNTAGNGLPFFQGKTDFGELYPRTRMFCSEPNKIAEPGDILISVRAPVGPTNFCLERSCVGRGLAAIRVLGDVDRWYLIYFLRFYEPQFAQVSKGSTFEAITRDDLDRIRVPLPPLPEQQRIAGILRRADRLRRLRRYALEMSESYLQGVFLEMFGGYLQSSQSSTEMGNLVEITGGGTPSREVARFYTGKIPWLTSKDMRGDYIWDSQEHITQEAIEQSATKLVPAKSILVVVKSKILMHRLPLAITMRPVCHGQDIKSIQCSDKLEPRFLIYVLKHNEGRLLAQARGANTEGLNLPMLREVPVPDVALYQQSKFVQIVDRFERVRAQQREALRQAEHLFQTLLHEAFREGGMEFRSSGS